MIVRIWRSQFDTSQRVKLVSYANEISLPVLSTRLGIRHVLFFAENDEWITMTIWESQAAIDRLGDDVDYQHIVKGILELEVLGAEQSVEIFHYEGGTTAMTGFGAVLDG